MKLQLALAIALVLSLGYSYLSNKRYAAQLETALVKVSLLESVNTQNLKTIQAIQINADNQARELIALNEKNTSLSNEIVELATKLADHDLEALSRAKPTLVENRINNGTKELFDSFELISTR